MPSALDPAVRQEAIADAESALQRLAQEREGLRQELAAQRGEAVLARGEADRLQRICDASETRLTDIQSELSIWNTRLENLKKGTSGNSLGDGT
jgi:flagellar biosynthesis chaperone FliJ